MKFYTDIQGHQRMDPNKFESPIFFSTMINVTVVFKEYLSTIGMDAWITWPNTGKWHAHQVKLTMILNITPWHRHVSIFQHARNQLTLTLTIHYSLTLLFLCMMVSHVQNAEYLITVWELINNLFDPADLTVWGYAGSMGIVRDVESYSTRGPDNAKEYIPRFG